MDNGSRMPDRTPAHDHAFGLDGHDNRAVITQMTPCCERDTGRVVCALLVALAVAASACGGESAGSLTCGPGTVQVGDTCTSATGDGGSGPSCGPGTVERE